MYLGVMVRKIIPYLFWIYIIGLLLSNFIPWLKLNHRVHIFGHRFRLDHIVHFISYFGATFLFVLYKFSKLPFHKLNKAFYLSTWLFAFAFFTEVLQLMVPGRDFSIKDFISNAMGISMALFITFLFQNLIIRFIYRSLNDYKFGN
jgi:hypothetical protein